MPIDLSLAGRRAVVGGASQGIGLAVARELAAQGAELILLARNRDRLEKLMDELPTTHGRRHSFYDLDFSDESAVRSLGEWLAARPPTHILVNNSGGPAPGPASEASPEQFVQAFQSHLIAFQILTQSVLAGMREAGYGRIINIISSSVIMPIRGLGVSNTLRGAVANWGRTLAAELGGDNITVNNLLPGYISTERLGSVFHHKAAQAGISVEQIEQQNIQAIPAGRFGRPEEIAWVAAFLASPAGAYVNGVNLPVDGGRLACQ